MGILDIIITIAIVIIIIIVIVVVLRTLGKLLWNKLLGALGIAGQETGTFGRNIGVVGTAESGKMKVKITPVYAYITKIDNKFDVNFLAVFKSDGYPIFLQHPPEFFPPELKFDTFK